MPKLPHLAGHILILSGHPGSGKTTTAQALAQLPGEPKVHLHSDDFWGYIKTGHIDPWLPEADAQNRIIAKIAAEVAGLYARAGYFVVLDGVVRPWWLPEFSRLSLPAHYIVLCTSQQEAIERCRKRGGDSLTDAAVIADLHAQFADLGRYSVNVLEVGGLTVPQALDATIAALCSDRYRLDWEQP